MKYLYYPGCSLKSTGKPYEESLKAVFSSLNVPLEELADWNCCGATAYMAVDEVKSFALSARNLALAEKQGEPAENGHVQLVAPCSACYALLLKTQHYLAENEDIRKKGGAGTQGSLPHLRRKGRRAPPPRCAGERHRHRKDQGERSNRPSGARSPATTAARSCRPYATFDDQANPTTLDTLMEAIGATPVDWAMKTRCCGGTLVGTIREVGFRLNYLILKEAEKKGAAVVATTCPLCQFGLECFQPDVNASFQADINLPVAYFTQLVGLAFGISEKELGMQRLFVPFKSASIGG